MCATNSGSSFDSAAYRRFISLCTFNHIGNNNLKIDLINKITSHAPNTFVANTLKSDLFDRLINEFFLLCPDITYGENLNLATHIEQYIQLYENYIYQQNIIIILLACIDFIQKQSVLQNQHDVNIVKNKSYRLCNIIETYYQEKYNVDVSFRAVVNIWLYNTNILDTNFEQLLQQTINDNIYSKIQS